MSKRTIVCRMVPTPVMAHQLMTTCEAFAKACNHALGLALESNTSNNIKLHHLAYSALRKLFGLSANLAVRAIRRTAAALTAAKRKKHKPALFRPISIDYDARIFEYREQDEVVSLTVLGGRIHVPLLLGEYQRGALAGKTPTAATVVRKQRGWAIHIVVEDDDAATPPGTAVLGIDLGVRNTAATSEGTLHCGEARQQYKERQRRTRSSLQAKGTQGARRVLARIAGHERRHIRHENHVLSRRIVAEAVNAHCGTIRMEELRGIRRRTRTWSRCLNRMIASWSFDELQRFVEYKAERAGIAVERVNPAWTSQTCSKCGATGLRTRDFFRCTTCDWTGHADINAALNIAGGAACKPARIGDSCMASAMHVAPESRLL
jgi:IS605 OrfB family transposase